MNRFQPTEEFLNEAKASAPATTQELTTSSEPAPSLANGAAAPDGGHRTDEAHAESSAVTHSPTGEAVRPPIHSNPSRPSRAATIPASDGGGEAPVDLRTPSTYSASPYSSGPAGEIDQASKETHSILVDLRFSDPLIAEIAALHRMQRRWLKARNALILQGKAFGRSLCDGDKKLGSDAYERVVTGRARAEDSPLEIALAPFIPAIERFDAEISAIERGIVKLAKRLPVAEWVGSVRGFGLLSLARVVGEAGELSRYPSVSGVWKRLGLAVIDGDGRQRRIADADRALIHGYSPERRSVMWVLADSMAKHQRTWSDKETGEVTKPAGPYGEVLETEKAKALAKGWTPAHAENHAKRVMSKTLLRDLTLEWRRVAESDRP